MKKEAVILKSPHEIERLRKSNAIVAEVLLSLKEMVRVGMTTMDLERRCEEEVGKRKATAAFKGYMDYPFCLCTSVNEEVVHGLPSDGRVLRDGDIVSIDFGALYDGFYGDAAITVGVGRIKPEAKRLLDVTWECLEKAIESTMIGNRLYDISYSIQGHAEGSGFSVVKAFVGHGIGKKLHEPPQVPNFGIPGTGIRLKEGMVLAIEPMINEGRSEVKVLDDGWTVVTADGKLSAHFEHSVAITKDGPVVLSRL